MALSQWKEQFKLEDMRLKLDLARILKIPCVFIRFVQYMWFFPTAYLLHAQPKHRVFLD